jgi:hypothetical protein
VGFIHHGHNHYLIGNAGLETPAINIAAETFSRMNLVAADVAWETASTVMSKHTGTVKIA